MNKKDSSEVAFQIAKSHCSPYAKEALLNLFKLERKKLNLETWHYTAEYEKVLQKALTEKLTS